MTILIALAQLFFASLVAFILGTLTDLMMVSQVTVSYEQRQNTVTILAGLGFVLGFAIAWDVTRRWKQKRG